ncbi:MAG: DUF4836 family protein [Aureispira sp.]|nr:DUF4836 family protein [Aureispira sp.]
MLRLSNVLYATLLFATTFTMVSCGGGGAADVVKSIPEDAVMVGTMDVKQLMEKADFEAVKQMDFYKDMLAEAEREAPEVVPFLKNPKESGISLDGNFGMFLKMNPTAGLDAEPFVTFMMPIADVAKVEDLMTKAREKNPNMPKAESKGDYQVIKVDNEMALAWSSNLMCMTNIQGDEEMAKLFNPEKGKSIRNNKSFKKHLKEKKDAMLWVTSDPLADALEKSQYSRDVTGALMFMQLSNAVLKDNSFSGYYNFEKGSIEAGAHFDLNEKLREEFGIVFKEKIDIDFTKYMPAEGLMSMGAFGLNLEGIENVLAKRMLNMPIDMALSEVGLSLKSLTGGLDGEMAFASYADTTAMGQSVVFALGLKDKSLVDKLLTLAETSGAKVERNGKRLTVSPPAMIDPMDPSLGGLGGMDDLGGMGDFGMDKIEAVITDDAIVFSNKAGVLDKIAAGGYSGAEAANNEYIKEAMSGWMGVYYDYEGMLKNMAEMASNPYGSPGLLSMSMSPMGGLMMEMMSKYNEFTQAVTVFKGHDTYGKVYMKTTDKNSLKRMLEIANELYKNKDELEKEFNKAMEEEEAKIEEEMKKYEEELDKGDDVNI